MVLSVVLLLAWQASVAWAVTEQEKRLQDSTTVLKEILDISESVPQDLLERCACIGIIPSVKKVAFVFGGRFGSGYVLCKKGGNRGPWGPPSAFSLRGGSVGFQLGLSATDFVLLFMNAGGIEKLLEDKFTLGADASVAGGPVGRTASAATDIQLSAQILSYSRSQGLFAGVALEGAVLRPSADDNQKLYGRAVTARDLLLVGDIPAPATAQPLISLLSGQTAARAASSTSQRAASRPAPGTISGSVRDTTGAVIPDAVITVTHSQSGASRWVTTTAEGRYEVAGLTPGDYQVHAQAAGLMPVSTATIALGAGSTQAVDFTLAARR